MLILGDCPPCDSRGTVPLCFARALWGTVPLCPARVWRGRVPSVRRRGGRALEVFALDLLEQFLDPRLVGDRLVELEGQLRHSAYVQPLGQRPTDERQRALERPRRLL